MKTTRPDINIHLICACVAHGRVYVGVRTNARASVGNELTPSAKYDFKFKDYAPWVFRELREDYFHLDPADYLLSLTAKYILSELGSPGKSGSFFYFSRDYRFIIKTIHHSEHKFLRSILRKYYEHVKNNPHSLISRFYGLHRVKLPHGRKIHFVIMNNLFPAHKDVHETYDLKGSTVGREYPEEKAAVNPRAVLKDLNWINRGKTLELGPEKRALLTEQLRRDSELLKELGVMDYSLLVGIHNMQRGNRDNVRRRTLKVFSVSRRALSFRVRFPSLLLSFHLTLPLRAAGHADHLAQEDGEQRPAVPRGDRDAPHHARGGPAEPRGGDAVVAGRGHGRGAAALPVLPGRGWDSGDGRGEREHGHDLLLGRHRHPHAVQLLQEDRALLEGPQRR